MFNDKNNYGIIAGKLGIIINLILGLSKLFLGLFSHSITIISDCFNNLTDMTSSILTIINFKLSKRNINKYRPYIYQTYEFYFSNIISLIMFILGTLFLIKSIYKIIHPEDIIINSITYIILFISLLLKTIQYILFKYFYNKTKSKTIKMTIIETRNDIITNTSIFISMIIMKLFNINLDGFLGSIVSLYIIYISLKNIISEIKILKINNNLIEDIKKIINKKYIINNIILHKYINQIYLIIYINTKDNIRRIKKMEKYLNDLFNINITIHKDN